MQWQESLRFAWWALTIDKIKASLTMLGVMIGSAAIVLVVTIASTGKVYILSQIEGIGANLTYATLDRNGHPVPEDEITPADLAAVRAALPVNAAAGTYDLPVNFRVRGKMVSARLVGVTEEFQQIRRLRITSGRYFDPVDFSSRDHACLITDRIAESAFRYEPAVGNSLEVSQFRCIIVGTFQEGVPTFGQSEIQDQTVLVPFPLVRTITGDNFLQVIYAQSTSSEEVTQVTDQMRNLLASRHRPQAHYNVENLASILRTARLVSIAMSAVLLAVAILMLITAGAGIMNIMLVNVAQRTREIGVRMAIGARPAEIRMQFLLEAVFISLGGAIAGVVGALLLIWSVAHLDQAIRIALPWAGIVAALLLSTGIGVLFGYRPASAAAKLNPVEALRAD